MAAYLLAAISIDNAEAYVEYVERGMAAAEKNPVKVLAIDDAPRLMEGTLPAKRFVLMEFADDAALQAFYHSEEYQSAIPIRQANAETSFLVSIDGLPQE